LGTVDEEQVVEALMSKGAEEKLDHLIPVMNRY
jgi:hypothetical protein